MIARVALGAALALLIAAGAHRARLLTASGAVAAAIAGAIASAAGWSWAMLLVAFFVSSSVLSRWGAAAKARRTDDIVSKRGPRDALQVAANGGVFTVAAALWLLHPTHLWPAAAAGALASAAADTWGTEVGTLHGGAPRRITTFERVPAGTSGAVSTPGLAATILGATFIAALAWFLHWPTVVALGALAGGVAGATADSLVGALIQARRRCPRCGTLTERTIHGCGSGTEHAGGVRWLDNDGVNVLATLAGAMVAMGIAW